MWFTYYIKEVLTMKKITKLTTLLCLPLLLGGCFGGLKDIGLEVNRDECFKRMNKLAREEGGYALHYSYYDGEELRAISFSEKDNVSYVVEGVNNALAFKNTGDYIHLYYGNPNSVTYMGSYEGDNYEQTVAQRGILYKAFYLETYYNKRSETETYLGREVLVYDFEYALDENKPSLKYEARIDKEYGIALELKCVDDKKADGNYLGLSCLKFNIKEDVYVPDLKDPEYITIIGQNETFKEAEMPTNLVMKVFITTDGEFCYVVSNEEGVYVYHHLDNANRHSYFYKKTDDGFKAYEKRYCHIEGTEWEECPDLDSKTRKGSLYRTYVNDLYSLQNMNESALVGYDIINGFNVEVREDRYSKYYFSRENNVFIKLLNKDQPLYLREVVKYNTKEVPEFLDTPDKPATNNATVAAYYEAN